MLAAFPQMSHRPILFLKNKTGEAIMADWMETHRAVVHPWYCDHIGHMNVRFYGHFFDDAGFHIWNRIDGAKDAMEKHGVGVVVARTTNDFIHEANAGELLVVKSGFTRLGNKSLTYTQRMTNAETGTLIATQEAVEVIFDAQKRQSTDMPDEIREILKKALVSVEED
tara:strand:- start:20411 stop:20914 length:504 start_codon:yes stop_codon:yes gene_type:complete